MGLWGSEVQILSLRPNKPSSIKGLDGFRTTVYLYSVSKNYQKIIKKFVVGDSLCEFFEEKSARSAVW